MGIFQFTDYTVYDPFGPSIQRMGFLAATSLKCRPHIPADISDQYQRSRLFGTGNVYAAWLGCVEIAIGHVVGMGGVKATTIIEPHKVQGRDDCRQIFVHE
jgi:hypothetical protein